MKENFEKLGLSDYLCSAIEELGYEEPTSIQRDAIPFILNKADIIGIAQTGTGKTAAFTLPMIDLLSIGRARARMPRSLILSPTRELAQQTAENFKLYGKNHSLSHALLIGGVSIDKQMKVLGRGVDVLIATPGRLLDHSDRGRLLLNAIEIFVIDEADRMLDMGFIPDIERIIKLLPAQRQTLLFSATMPAPIEKLASRLMRSPQRVAASMSGKAAQTIEQSLIWTTAPDKIILLAKHLREMSGNAIVFCNRKRDVDRVYRALKQDEFRVEAIHGDMPQFKRGKVLERFRSEGLPILVASNVAARGLDIANISHVINFDVPQIAEDYVHRIGRTGRAGKAGSALILATKDELDFVKAIEVLMKESIPVLGNQPRPHESSSESGSRSSKPRGSRPRGSKPNASKPRGSRPRGAKPNASKPNGSKTRGSKPYGSKPHGSKPHGSKRPSRPGGGPGGRSGSRGTGSRPSGSRPSGSRGTGSRPSGSRGSGSRPSGSRPSGSSRGR